MKKSLFSIGLILIIGCCFTNNLCAQADKVLTVCRGHNDSPVTFQTTIAGDIAILTGLGATNITQTIEYQTDPPFGNHCVDIHYTPHHGLVSTNVPIIPQCNCKNDPFKDAAEDAATKVQAYLYTKHHGGDTTATANTAIASVVYLNDNFDTEQEWATADQRWSPITQIGCIMGCARWYSNCMKNDHSIGAFIKCSDAADKCMALCGVHL